MIRFLDLLKVNQQYETEIKTAMNRVFDSGWYIHGNAVKQFEENYASYCGSKHCISVANGLDVDRSVECVVALVEVAVGHPDEVVGDAAEIRACFDLGAPALVAAELDFEVDRAAARDGNAREMGHDPG